MSDEGEFAIGYKDGHGNMKRIAISFGVVVLLVGAYTAGVQKWTERDIAQSAVTTRVASVEGAVQKANEKLQTIQDNQYDSAAQIRDLKGRVAYLEASLSTANATLQKISESNARLEERVIFLVAQVEGRLPNHSTEARK